MIRANFLLDSESRLRAAIARHGNGRPRSTEAANDPEDHRVLRPQPVARAAGRGRAVRAGRLHPARRSASTRCPTSPTPRSSSTRAGTARPTSSRTRSPTRSSPRCSARRRSRRSAASPTSASPTSTSSSRTAPTSTGRARACSSTCRRSSRACRRACRPSSARRDRRRLGLPVRARRPLAATTRSTSCAPSRTGRCATRCSRCPGVAEVASIGGFVKQYQITVDPNRLAAYDIPLDMVVAAVRELEQRGRRPAARVRRRRVHGARPRLRPHASRTSSRSSSRSAPGGVPVLLRDVARVELGPEIRRGVSDLDGLGDHVGGIVVMRHGENALNVIERVKEKLARARAVAARGRRDRHHLRPLRPDRRAPSTR